MRRVGIWGASGMAGGEVLRLLARHPEMETVRAVSARHAGEPVWHQHPHLRHALGDMVFSSPEEARRRAEEVDLVFLAVPHGAGADIAAFHVARGVRVADMSADFRLRDPEDHRRWYGTPHPCPDLLARAVYGLPEFHREALRETPVASGVGCNATCTNLGLRPLAARGLIREARIEVRAGSSEGGGTPTVGSHHPYRRGALRVVEPFRHRHAAEVAQETGMPLSAFSFTLTAAEMVRGAQMLAHVTLTEAMEEKALWRLYREAYGGEPFVELCPARPAHLRFPDPRRVLGSNRALVGFALDEGGTRLLVGCAIDNLMKGAAGSAVQCANLMLGFEETAGLDALAVYPA
ncbi:MAG TPA: N-acetyl-gamma-glutamyl-phosphate reductase [Synergistaceae bacterium]|nr:N-acetyl-gamma-glutamyl-phosphate reductase [Synergistaceae bacterium]HQF91436.1 N-acetyl-gamma-glutamyl-phosphate reductase [Synergistaceae bacterium]HQH77754.1 N-acetyl-gamma-glutamyl-phosphate reductase [Synergistaceae bacterium]HQK25362.1 N-acetyl-gamma-glutamyl-phosphate reductase [Synergistaceae bacterium]